MGHQPNLYLSHGARVYDRWVGPGPLFLPGPTAPTMLPVCCRRRHRLGRQLTATIRAKPPERLGKTGGFALLGARARHPKKTNSNDDATSLANIKLHSNCPAGRWLGAFRVHHRDERSATALPG